jgi:hypothetical protein
MKNAIVFVDEKPFYELNAEEIIFPIRLEQDGQEVIGNFAMDAQYPSHEVKAFLDDLQIRERSNDTDEREVELGDEAGCRDFVTKHFHGILGIEEDISREDMLAWLHANSDQKTRIYVEGYDKILLAPEEGSGKLRIVLGSSEGSVKGKRILFVPEAGIITVNLEHKHRRITEEDRLKFRRATKMIEKGPRRLVRTNWDVMEQLYESIFQSLEGYLIDGAACTAENKPTWVKKVPFSDRMFAINRIMRRVAIKNG